MRVNYLGTATLTVEVPGPGEIDRNGKVTLTAKVTFTPSGGAARTQSKKIKLEQR